MNDDLLTAAWLAEMWPTVRQYDRLPPAPRKPVGTVQCPECERKYAPSYLTKHLLRAHPQDVDRPGKSVDGMAS